MKSTAGDEHLLIDRANVDHILFDWLQVHGLAARPRFRDLSSETVTAIVDLCSGLAATYFQPCYQTVDRDEPRVVGGLVETPRETAMALAAFTEAGLFALTQDEILGGLQLPHVIARAAFLWFQAANPAVAAYPFLTVAAANLLIAHGTAELVETYAKPMLAGRFFGTMCMSEPSAGSSLGEVRTMAVPCGDGRYRLTGSKMWISGGDHELSENIVHMVLARTPDAPAGARGLSLFLTPKYLVRDESLVRNDVTLIGLNHKMGYRGTTNCLLGFGDGVHRPDGEAGAVGYMVGELHGGLAAMFHMMNEARIGVGAGAAALGSASYLHALSYANTRRQGRAHGSSGKDASSVIAEHPDVRRMLLAQKTYVEGGIALVLYCAMLADDQATALQEDDREAATELLELLTPVAKSWPSQWGLVANDLAIQIHGGYGYTRDFCVEQMYRDNRLNPIHEGTHGIQALDLMRKLTGRGGYGLRCLADRVKATCAQAAGTEAAAHGEALRLCWQVLEDALDRVLTFDPHRRAWSATDLLETFGHLVVAWLWLDQGLALRNRSDDFAQTKRQSLDFMFGVELPRARHRLESLGWAPSQSSVAAQWVTERA